jgi:transcriptional regulator with PAS, ATPase and Fis domain
LLPDPSPGKVRELEQELERALTLAGDATLLTIEHFSERVIASGASLPGVRFFGSLRQARGQFEKDYIANALRAHDGNVSQAARALGISRVMLQKKMKDLGLRSSSAA